MTCVALEEQARPRKRKRKAAPIDAVAEEAGPEPSAARTREPSGEADASGADEAEPATPADAAKAQVEPSRFLRSFPNDPALAPLVAAFERGDYAYVRAAAPALATRTKDEQVRRAALELRRRIDPDPLALLLVGFAFALLITLALFYWTNKHP